MIARCTDGISCIVYPSGLVNEEETEKVEEESNIWAVGMAPV